LTRLLPGTTKSSLETVRLTIWGAAALVGDISGDERGEGGARSSREERGDTGVSGEEGGVSPNGGKVVSGNTDCTRSTVSEEISMGISQPPSPRLLLAGEEAAEPPVLSVRVETFTASEVFGVFCMAPTGSRWTGKDEIGRGFARSSRIRPLSCVTSLVTYWQGRGG